MRFVGSAASQGDVMRLNSRGECPIGAITLLSVEGTGCLEACKNGVYRPSGYGPPGVGLATMRPDYLDVLDSANRMSRRRWKNRGVIVDVDQLDCTPIASEPLLLTEHQLCVPSEANSVPVWLRCDISHARNDPVGSPSPCLCIQITALQTSPTDSLSQP